MPPFDKPLDPPSKEDYAKLLMAAIHETGDQRSIKYEPDAFQLVVEESREQLLNLGNLYGEYCKAKPASRENMLRKTVKSWLEAGAELPDSLEEARTDLLPIVRSRSYLEAFSIEARLKGNAPPNWPHQLIGEHLAMGLVYDMPYSMATIMQQTLDKWGISFYEAFEIALENLRQMDCGVAACTSPRLYVVDSKDFYDASRLVHLDFVRHLEVEGDHVAMVPNRSQLIITGSDEEAGLAAMAELAEKTLKKPRPLSGVALRLVGDEWQVWLPPEAHPSRKAFKTLAVQSLGQEYAEQKELLDRVHEETGEDTFVANFSGVMDRAGNSFSYCIWAKGTVSLLPQTDKVAFFEQGVGPLMADWDKVFEECRHLMRSMDWYPERFFVEEFPTREELMKVGASEV